MEDLRRNQGRLQPNLVGINDASTFLGFCQRHDTETFAPLETTELVPTDEQAVLLGYRPLCKELYAKTRQLESLSIARDFDKGSDPHLQQIAQEFIALTRAGVEKAIEDLRHHKALFDRDMLARDFAAARFVAIHIDRPPDLMCSGIVQPTYTFAGDRIQDLTDMKRTLDSISFTLAAAGAGGVAIFAWRSDSDAACSALVDSLLQLAPQDLPAAIVRFVTSEFENTYLRPEWWEGLGNAERDALLERMHHGISPAYETPPDYLIDDGHRFVSWGVTGIHQKRS